MKAACLPDERQLPSATTPATASGGAKSGSKDAPTLKKARFCRAAMLTVFASRAHLRAFVGGHQSFIPGLQKSAAR